MKFLGNNINNFRLYKVPLTSNIYQWIKKIHYDLDHRSFQYVKYEILQNKCYYKGIYNYLKNVINKCEIYSMKNGNVMKGESQLLKKYENIQKRYVGDLADISYEFRKTNKFKYIFAIIDHFSKLEDSYLLKNKSANEVLNSLRIFSERYGLSNELSSDNEHEFVNSSIQNFANENNINLINGRPYNPKSQEIVEKIHSTIRKALL